MASESTLSDLPVPMEPVQVEPVQSEPADPPPPMPCPDGTDISDVTPLFYVYRDARSIGRFKPMGATGHSIGVKCFIHANCSLPLYTKYRPPMSDLKKWLASAELPLPGDNRAEKARKAASHKNDLVVLRDHYKDEHFAGRYTPPHEPPLPA